MAALLRFFFNVQDIREILIFHSSPARPRTSSRTSGGSSGTSPRRTRRGAASCPLAASGVHLPLTGYLFPPAKRNHKRHEPRAAARVWGRNATVCDSQRHGRRRQRSAFSLTGDPGPITNTVIRVCGSCSGCLSICSLRHGERLVMRWPADQPRRLDGAGSLPPPSVWHGPVD